MKLLLIRHGETTGDIEDRYGGSYDDHLTERGREQLKATAESVIDKGIEIIFHSPLTRARESAEVIAESVGCPIKQWDGLEERHYGVLTGLTKQEALEKYPDAVEAHKDLMNTDPEGESFADFNKRVVTAFEAIPKESYQVMAILAHGGSLKRILELLRQPLPPSIADGGVIEVEV